MTKTKFLNTTLVEHAENFHGLWFVYNSKISALYGITSASFSDYLAPALFVGVDGDAG